MTVKELYTNVALLGFEENIDEEETFYPALNTALHDIFRMVPIKRRALLAHYPPDTLLVDTEKVLYSNGVLSYCTEGAKAYYIEISGKGAINFSDVSGERIKRVSDVDFEKVYGYQIIKGFCRKSDGTFPSKLCITINAKTLCKVKAIAIYGDMVSDNADDIPAPDKYTVYNLERIIPDLSMLSARPRWEGGDTLKDFFLEGNMLSVPREYKGDIELTYAPKIHEYTVDDNDMDIDLPDEYIGALKLLIASYVWLDDNASRAQYYKGLYNEEIALISAKHRDLNPIKYESVNNW